MRRGNLSKVISSAGLAAAVPAAPFSSVWTSFFDVISL
jgi:hypothetical protein